MHVGDQFIAGTLAGSFSVMSDDDNPCRADRLTPELPVCTLLKNVYTFRTQLFGVLSFVSWAIVSVTERKVGKREDKSEHRA